MPWIWTRSLSMRPRLHGDDVHQATGDDDDLAHVLALDLAGNGLAGSSLELVLGGVSRNLDSCADLALDLDGNLDGVALRLLGVKGGPGLVVDGARKAQRLMVELLGPVRTDGCEHGNDIVGDAPAEGSVTPLGGDLVGVLGGSVHEFHDGRDGGVELAAVEV